MAVRFAMGRLTSENLDRVNVGVEAAVKLKTRKTRRRWRKSGRTKAEAETEEVEKVGAEMVVEEADDVAPF